MLLYYRYLFNISNVFYLLSNARTRLRENDIFLYIYSDCIITVDSYKIIIIFLIFWLDFMFSITDIFVVSVFDACC
jgi:hypothetical protein